MNSVNRTRIQVLESLIKDEPSRIANLANASAWLNECLDTINWVGFYLLEEDELVLGPFQGKTACVRIKMGKGVCGTSAEKREILRVPDVHEFPGHIACDAASRSEIVIPLIKGGNLLGVLDIDSPVCDRFSEDDQQFLEAFAETLVTHL
ncbi:GAF domain-containing protein [Sporolactobacillus sp. CPB3-1]|uniref:GAF domain-containing protein n=1 Tax=Sporolactobacillus mangiferae TaxID=2940498 RepID=A0ABT0M7N0_9BACL|nr:GAF domain-containing protein [Sporolactobacillus mangiferae]MCL1630638.1 GAF domain-containing protein [Sporolactobacillus mangiferae]